MGCVYSSVDKEETVVRCKERRRLIKQLVRCRSDLATAYLGYLQSLRNTGATLRQFVEDGPDVPRGSVGLSRSPLPLPPSPPPPPTFSPDSRRDGNQEGDEIGVDTRGHEDDGVADVSEGVDDDEDDVDDAFGNGCNVYAPPPRPPPPPPPIRSLDPNWEEFWNHAAEPAPCSTPSSPAPHNTGNGAPVQEMEEENWAETNTDFAEDGVQNWEGNEETKDGLAAKPLIDKLSGTARDLLVEDNSSAVSWFTKDSETAMVIWRNRKTLAGIVKELDDYFLKASEAGTEVVALLQSNRSHILQQNIASHGKKNKSAKVFSSLSWRWSSRSPLSSKDTCGTQSSAEFYTTGNHCATLDKIFSAEQKLYKEVKEEETAKVYHKKQTLLLQKEESGDQDGMGTEKIRTSIERLENEMGDLQESINETCLSISKLRDNELYPQLSDLSSRLLHLWRTMYECHHVQNHIAQQTHHIHLYLNTEPTNDSHLNATLQLEEEVTSWHNAFCKVLKCQREYAHMLNQWVKLTDCLPDSAEMLGLLEIYALCEEWKLALDRLADKVAGEAIKSFISTIHSIGIQLVEERKLQVKFERLKKKLDKETRLCKTEKNYNQSVTEDTLPMSTKQTKLEALKKRVEAEKVKYLNCVCTSRTMMLNSLQTGLPNVFQAMTVFAGMCMQAFEGVHQHSITGDGFHTNCTSPM